MKVTNVSLCVDGAWQPQRADVCDLHGSGGDLLGGAAAAAAAPRHSRPEPPLLPGHEVTVVLAEES